MPDNLWPNFDSHQALRSPRSVIYEAGAGLKDKTHGLLSFHALPVSIKDKTVDTSFSLLSQQLTYSFPFLRARFNVETFYPVTITAHQMPDAVANDESELIATLAKIFNAPSTVETIQRLLSLSEK